VQGARIARHAARDNVYVAGAIGPLGIRVEPWGKTGVDEAEEHFREQARALVDGSVDLFVLETFRDVNELGAAIRAVRSVCSLPIVAQMTTEEDGNSLDGVAPKRSCRSWKKRAPMCSDSTAAWDRPRCSRRSSGCARHPHEAFGAAERRPSPRDRRSQPVFVLAGIHGVVRPPIHQQRRPPGWGCCGTTPDHIRHIKMACGRLPPRRSVRSAIRSGSLHKPAVVPVPRSQKSRMAHTLARGGFPISVELIPPRGYQSTALIEQARQLKIRASTS
jgi:homocysteine S-methyltransferase